MPGVFPCYLCLSWPHPRFIKFPFNSTIKKGILSGGPNSVNIKIGPSHQTSTKTQNPLISITLNSLFIPNVQFSKSEIFVLLYDWRGFSSWHGFTQIQQGAPSVPHHQCTSPTIFKMKKMQKETKKRRHYEEIRWNIWHIFPVSNLKTCLFLIWDQVKC